MTELSINDFFPTQQEKEIITETEALAKINQTQPPLTDTPTQPTKADIILEVCNERDKLKELRQAIYDGKKRPSNQLKAILYITQIIISANKVALDALKDNIQINAGHIDITTEINELIKISRDEDCSNSNKLQA